MIFRRISHILLSQFRRWTLFQHFQITSPLQTFIACCTSHTSIYHSVPFIDGNNWINQIVLVFYFFLAIFSVHKSHYGPLTRQRNQIEKFHGPIQWICCGKTKNTNKRKRLPFRSCCEYQTNYLLHRYHAIVLNWISGGNSYSCLTRQVSERTSERVSECMAEAHSCVHCSTHVRRRPMRTPYNDGHVISVR